MVFHVTIERDTRGPDETVVPGFEGLFEDSEIDVSFLSEDRGPELEPVDLDGVDAYVSYSYQLTADSLRGVEGLKIAARAGAGYDNYDLEAMTDHGVIATHAPQGPTASAAQATVQMILSCAHNIPAREHALRTEGWGARREIEFGFELQSATLGYIGMGLIGGKVQENLAPFREDGLQTQVFDPYMSAERAAALGVDRVDLDQLLTTSDIISIHVPLTDETHHMLGYEDFKQMQDTAYLVNTSRGGIYPDADLARALREGELAGGAIDVFEDESNTENNPLLAFDDIQVTPHVAGVTNSSIRRIREIMTDSILAIKNGEPPRNVLNPDAYEQMMGERLPDEYRSPSFQG